MLKKYKIITTEELLTLDENFRRNSRMSAGKDKAVIIYSEEIEGGMNITELQKYMDENLDDWIIADIT